MNAPLWYRSEDKHGEERAVLTPAIVAELIGAGHSVTVERSAQRCFDDDAYASAGATLADGNSWRDAPSDAVIVGLKELNVDTFDLRHRHIHFAHVYKEQQGWQAVLERFKRGGGSLYDLEYLVDDTGRRVAAFGYWAGYAGAAVAVMAWIGQQQDQTPSVAPLSSYSSRDVLLASLTSQLAEPGVVNSGKPTALVIGAKGRSGKGAVELLHNLGIDVIEWDVDETRDGGPFEQLLAVNIVINCVFIQQPLPPFLTADMLQQQRQLSVLCDVSCDPYGDYNPLPIYQQTTSFDQPVARLVDGPRPLRPLDLIAIDHLPSLLPVESSEDFVLQLRPHLLRMGHLDTGVWQTALTTFEQKSGQLVL